MHIAIQPSNAMRKMFRLQSIGFKTPLNLTYVRRLNSLKRLPNIYGTAVEAEEKMEHWYHETDNIMVGVGMCRG